MREGALNEADLARGAKQGEQAAWTALVSAHQEAVFRLAYLILGEAEEARDVTQETFVAALRAIDRFDVNRPLRPWLLKIAANSARNRRRSLGRYLTALRRTLREMPDHANPPADAAAKAVDAHQLWLAARRLDAADQEIIYLRFFLELPVAEAAESLGVAPGTVKSRLHRALGRLRQVVESEYPWLIEGFTDERAVASQQE